MAIISSLSLDPYPSVQLITTILEITASIHNMVLLFYHIYSVIQHRRVKNRTSRLEILSIISLFLMVIFNILTTRVSAILHQFMNIDCTLLFNSAASEYLCSKISLYFLFLERLFSVFQNTHYSFKPLSIWISRILLLFIYLPIMIYLLFATGHHWYDPKFGVCTTEWPLWVHAILSLGDFCIGLVISILFTRRLMMLGMSRKKKSRSHKHKCSHSASKSQSANSDNTIGKIKRKWSKRTMSAKSIKDIKAIKRHPTQRSQSDLEMDLTQIVIDSDGKVVDTTDMNNDEITRKCSTPIVNSIMNDKLAWDALNKFTLLAVLSILTTLTSLTLAAFFSVASLWISIDTMINSWCIVLMFGAHKKLYVSLCGSLQKLTISIKCLSCYSCHCCCCKIRPPSFDDIMAKHRAKHSTAKTPYSTPEFKLGVPSRSSMSKMNSLNLSSVSCEVSVSRTEGMTTKITGNSMGESKQAQFARDVQLSLQELANSANIEELPPRKSANSMRIIGPSELAPISEDSHAVTMGSLVSHEHQLSLTSPSCLSPSCFSPSCLSILTPPIGSLSIITPSTTLFDNNLSNSYTADDPEINSDPEIPMDDMAIIDNTKTDST